MRNLIDTIFGPVLIWLNNISSSISSLSVPVSRPINFGRYFGHLSFLGPHWITFITTVCTLAFIYFVIYLIKTQSGLFIKFKDMIKWW